MSCSGCPSGSAMPLGLGARRVRETHTITPRRSRLRYAAADDETLSRPAPLHAARRVAIQQQAAQDGAGKDSSNRTARGGDGALEQQTIGRPLTMTRRLTQRSASGTSMFRLGTDCRLTGEIHLSLEGGRQVGRNRFHRCRRIVRATTRGCALPALDEHRRTRDADRHGLHHRRRPVALMAWVRTPNASRQFPPVPQPVAFDHSLHVKGFGIDCRYCHSAVERSATAGIPPTTTCVPCHSDTWMSSRNSRPCGEPDDRPTIAVESRAYAAGLRLLQSRDPRGEGRRM